jgi:FtsP/CotA-like multicopper oxidase with cupredoxin domain
MLPAPLTDTNADPNIVEVQLVAVASTHEYLPGKRADVWAFRDGAKSGSVASIPGPLLEAKLGDKVIVHFRNELPEETTIHWHGLRVPNAADGTPFAQLAVQPGGTYDYEFTLIDSGLFWYPRTR